MMPADADLLDVRYNVIQWVHRWTRGWSYGAGVTDPRTGEILKGHVTLGSLRVRQDYLIAEGLTSPYQTGTETPPELAQVALARLRQLRRTRWVTPGIRTQLLHSKAGRIRNGLSAPLVTLRADGTIDLPRIHRSHWDWTNVAVRYVYGHFRLDERRGGT